MIKNEWKTNLNSLIINPWFLQTPFIKGLMFSSDDGIFINEIRWIENNYPQKLDLLKNPNLFGNPDIKIYNGERYNPNDIHMAYHFLKYYNFNPIQSPLKIFEWGGGYGNLYKIIKLLFPELVERYTIVDLPQCLEMQKYYLHNLNLLDDKIEFYSSLNLPDTIPDHDLFVSTWAISESPTECFEYLKNKNFYSCNRFLIALHQCGNHIPFMQESTVIFNHFISANTHAEEISFIPGKNYYIFK
jgi:hypothetical protein